MALVVIEVPEGHMPFVRQQVDLHGPEVRLDFEHFIAQLQGSVVGVLAEVNAPTPGKRYRIEEVMKP